jgi:hypothetical protein
MRYELRISAGEATVGGRHFVSDEGYAVGERITVGGEVWRIDEIEHAEDANGVVTRLLCVPEGRDPSTSGLSGLTR